MEGAGASAPDPLTNPEAYRWKATDLPDLRGSTDLEDSLDRQPASKAFEESIKDSYHKANRCIERSRSSIDQGEYAIARKPRRDTDMEQYDSVRRYRLLDRAADITGDERLRRRATKVDDDDGEFLVRGRRTYAGTVSGAGDDKVDGEDSATPTTRYYSRRTLDDPDYFDFDLNHAVEEVKKERNYGSFGKTPGSQYWEQQLVKEMNLSGGDKNVAPYMFLKGEGGESDWRQQNNSYLSAALRTPSFWTRRFEQLQTIKPSYVKPTHTTSRLLTDADNDDDELPTSSYKHTWSNYNKYLNMDTDDVSDKDDA